MPVYLMFDPSADLYKIGHSTDPKARLYTVRSKRGEPDIDLVTTIETDADRNIERTLHFHFRDQRRELGEWFDLREQVVDWFETCDYMDSDTFAMVHKLEKEFADLTD